MKYFKISIIFILVLVTMKSIYPTNDITEKYNINKYIKNININTSNAKISILNSSYSNFVIETSVSKQLDKKMQFIVDYGTSDLNIGQFMKQDKEMFAYSEIKILIPKDYSLGNIEINNENGAVFIDQIVGNKVQIQGNDNILRLAKLDVNECNINVPNASFNVDSSNLNILNTTVKNGDVNIRNSSIVRNNINVKKGKFNIIDSDISEVALLEKTNINNLVIDRLINYELYEATNIKDKNFKKKNNNYFYYSDQNSITNKIYLNGNRINKILYK